MDRRTRHLQQLVDAGALDALLAEVSPDEIAAAWIRHGARPSWTEDDPDRWAAQLFVESNAVYEHGDGMTIRPILLALIEAAADDDDMIGRVGAGPLENFVSNDPSAVRWLEQQCRHNERLRDALASAWFDDSVSPEVAQRLKRAAEFAPPRFPGQ